MKTLKQGFIKGIGMCMALFASAIFAFTVSGTVKTWNTGDTLTATDLNTTVQSLKTAVESASQFATVSSPYGNTGNVYSPLLVNGSGSFSSTTELQIPIPRDGTVKNARLTINNNIVPAACTLTLRKNAVDTAITFNVPANSTTTVTSASTVTFVSGDNLSWKMNCGAQQNNMVAFISFEF
jgi:hypothetical protein